MANYTVYVDESGNSGVNFLDPKQPILTFAALGIKHENMADITTEELRLRKKYKISPHVELKAKNIFRRHKHMFIKDLLEMLMQHGSSFMLFCSVYEKLYAVASYIDYDFLDTEYNSLAKDIWHDPPDKHALRADIFYNNLSKRTLAACAKAFTTGENLLEAYNAVRGEIKDKKSDSNLYDILSGVEEHLEELANGIKRLYSGRPLDKPVLTPNFSAFCGIINKAEYWYRNVGVRARVVFSESKEYNKLFLDIFQRLRAAPKKAVVKIPGRQPFILGYESLTEFTYESAETSTFLQYADLAASALQRAVRKVQNGETVFDELDLFMLVLALPSPGTFQITDLVISGELVKGIFSTLANNMPVGISRVQADCRQRHPWRP